MTKDQLRQAENLWALEKLLQRCYERMKKIDPTIACVNDITLLHMRQTIQVTDKQVLLAVLETEARYAAQEITPPAASNKQTERTFG